MNFFSRAFWLAAFERGVVAGAATFAASDFFAGAFTVHGLEVAGSAAGMAALYAFVKQLGAVSATKALAAQAAGAAK